MSTRYVVITPARNEKENISATIRSMTEQTILPEEWVIVNDGSTDCTGSIIDDAGETYPWIKPMHRPDRGYRLQGGGVVEAFNAGYDNLETRDWEFLVKFDADLSFEPDYFERCLRKFEEDPSLGIGGGTISHEVKGKLVSESPGDPKFHVRGATKIYSRICWRAIGGLYQAPGWDTIDEMAANMYGYATYTYDDIPLKHHRYTGAVDGTWKNYVKFGLSNYITGYLPLFMLLKSLKRLSQKPYVIGSIGLMWGFCIGYIKVIKQVDDPKLIKYVRRQQLNKLLGKESLW